MVVLAMRWEGSNDIYLIGQEIEKKKKKEQHHHLLCSPTISTWCFAGSRYSLPYTLDYSRLQESLTQ